MHFTWKCRMFVFQALNEYDRRRKSATSIDLAMWEKGVSMMYGIWMDIWEVIWH